MTQQVIDEQESTQIRRRGPGKPFPSITFKDALFLPKSILEYALDGEIQRLTLLDELGMASQSSKTRGLISGSYKYGLTNGSYRAPTLSVTEKGRLIAESDLSSHQFKTNAFELAINQFEPFRQLYDKLKERPLREGQVLQDGLGLDQFSDADRSHAAEIFTANLRFIGLVQDVAGSEHVRDIQLLVREGQDETADPATESTDHEAEAEDEAVASQVENGNVRMPANRPALHIDIQVHIDPTSSADQIDQIFASMAKHLYGDGQ